MLNIADAALPLRDRLGETAPIVMIAGTSMNSGKTYAATELIKQATHDGLRVAAAKLSGVACLRDTLNMADHGAVATASFLDCGLPSTVGAGDLAPIAKAIIARLNESAPDLIVIELGDGILGGYSVDSVFDDVELREATAALIFCASDYVGAWGGIELLRKRGIEVAVVSGSVTDSQMGEDYIEKEFGVPAANAKRHGANLYKLIKAKDCDARAGGSRLTRERELLIAAERGRPACNGSEARTFFCEDCLALAVPLPVLYLSLKTKTHESGGKNTHRNFRRLRLRRLGVVAHSAVTSARRDRHSSRRMNTPAKR